jgi:predicted transcriptional regulator
MVKASPSDILGAIADDRASLLFDTIALSHSETSDVLLAKLKFTQKEYYSRMSKLVKANLVNRRQGKYFLTSLGNLKQLMSLNHMIKKCQRKNITRS